MLVLLLTFAVHTVAAGIVYAKAAIFNYAP
jgi:hypothetical protein